MPIAYRVDRVSNLVLSTWTGRIDAPEACRYWRALLRDPEAVHCRRSLSDLRHAEFATTGPELRTVLESVVFPLVGRRPWMIAVVAASDVTYGTARQAKAFLENHGAECEVFRDYPDALRWLYDHDADEAA